MNTTLRNLTSLDPMAADTWEVGMFAQDCAGRMLDKPILGVRVNGGAWIPADALQDAFVLHQVSKIHEPTVC